uniref:Uncharacterized protein n=1 Tax=Leersia perrieri TaxID=77586 RepID=A0A0D9W2I7_9ORYZ
MKKRCSILLLLGLVLLFSNAIVEVSASQNKVVFSRKGLKDERKLAVTGTGSSLGGLQGQSTSTSIGGVTNNNNIESTNAETGDTSSAYTPMSTATTTDSHHDMSVDQYRKIIHNNQINKP